MKMFTPCALLAVFAVAVFALSTRPCQALSADPSLLPKVAENAVGYPSRDANLDVLPGFVEPPAGYGEVPFYWWLGDPLTKERLSWHIEQFKRMGISGLQINYAHSDKGGNIWGLTYPSDPPLFSDDWWKLVQWWSGECKKQGIAISLSDYTLGIVGQGYWMDEILAEDPTMRGSNLDHDFRTIRGGAVYTGEVPENTICATAYRLTDGKVVPGSGADLRPYIDGHTLRWDAPEGDWQLAILFSRVVQNSVDPMNPKTGPMIIDKFFGRFEKHLPGEGGKGLDFFFSDELNFGIGGNLWSTRFADEFAKRKGYDIVPKLAAIFEDVGPETPKIRLDYRDVMVSLEEEAYFEPVFRWHYDRGMVYGCDHGGRGTDVTEFGDYFRTQRWMTGPGCDQPGLADDVVKNKVASSIAHLYERPRTWLEGYHSSGWGTNTAQLTDATFKNFAQGQNLLSLHGLYYSTHGGFWEWAPPCNHFRMPYWAHMAEWFKCVRRLSYTMSQGVHRCDVAIIYPVAAVEAGMDGGNAVGTAFDTGRRLYDQGIDFDYMDFESLDRAKVVGKELQVSGEAYKVLVIPAMKAVRFSTVQKALEFKRAGGIVVALGALPEASDNMGRDDAELNAMVKEAFGETPSGFEQLQALLRESVDRDFIPSNGCFVNHRKIGKRDIYLVVGAQKGSECFFRAKGKVELWDPWTGKATPLPVVAQTDKGTTVKMPLEPNEATLIAFTQDEKPVSVPARNYARCETIKLDGKWEFELKPTLDNRFGDFRLPIDDKVIGAEGRIFDYTDSVVEERKTYGFGQTFWVAGPLKKGADTSSLESTLAQLASIKNANDLSALGLNWRPYEYGLRQGIEGDPGHEGYHGLKEQISDDFIALGRRNFGATDSWYSSESDDAGAYYLWTTVLSDKDVDAKIIAGGMMPSKVWIGGREIADLRAPVKLEAGNTPLLLKYDGAGRGHFVLVTSEYKDGPNVPLSMSWYQKPGVLLFDPHPSSAALMGSYRLSAPPGLRSMTIVAHGKVHAKVGTDRSEEMSKMTVKQVGNRADGSTEYIATAPRPVAGPSSVVLQIEQEKGYYGGNALPEPVKWNCGPGEIELGDWCQYGLECYSGGAWYRKSVTLTPEQSKGRVTLRLGDLTSSAEVRVNSKPAGVKLAPPWNLDISSLVKPGENRIEVLVYNTLASHYVTIPTRYRGDTRSGLFGPVSLEIAL